MTKSHINAIEVKAIEQALTDSPDFLKTIVREALQEILEAEMTDHLGADKHERSESRTGVRNGYKTRQLNTRVGKIALAIPQARDGSFSTELFARYSRSEKALVSALMEMYLKGVSTRKVADITEKLCGTSFSASQVSTITKRLDKEIAAWKSRSLGAYPYLMVDARYEKVRTAHGVISQGVLITVGITESGYREVIDVTVADTENKTTYEELFRDLRARGLGGVKLVISDAHAGLKAALSRYFQGAAWQRCQVHFIRDACTKVSYSTRSCVVEDVSSIFAKTTLESAMDRAAFVAQEYSLMYLKFSEFIEDHIEECLAVLSFPSAHQKRLRTNNTIERLNQEIKRKTTVLRIFPNEGSALRLIGSLCIETSEEWLCGKRYLNMKLLEDQEEKEKVMLEEKTITRAKLRKVS
jgi:transposase-like protein